MVIIIMVTKKEDTYKPVMISEKSLIPISAVAVIIAVVWSFASVRSTAAEAKACADINAKNISDNTKRLTEIEKINAVINTKLTYISDGVDEIKKRILK